MSITNLVVLEIINLFIKEKKVKIYDALKRVILYDLYKTFPLIIIWSIIWFIVEFISAFFRPECDEKKMGATLQNYVTTLSGYG